jgi:hypothetical protein
MFYWVGLVCNGGRGFTPTGFSIIPLQVPLAPMRLFAIGVELALVEAIQSHLPCPFLHISTTFLIFRNCP